MLFSEISLYGQIVLVFLGLIVIFPLITIISIFVYQFIKVMRLPRTSMAGATAGQEALSGKLGLTMADGGESVDKQK